MKSPVLLRLITSFLYWACAVLTATAEPVRQPLKVLYVGGSGNWERETYATPEAAAEDAARRTASFEALLNRYFATVGVVQAGDYRQELSADYDVTVFDGTPTQLEARQVIRDESGRVTDVIAARYLNEDFDRPALLIGELGERLGRRIGLKFDWYCLCLDAHAHSFRAEHPIFRGPFSVQMTIEELPTPEDAFHYEYYRETLTPKTLPMWRVQTKGYQTDRGFRIGMVARPWGFEDSPDAEFISGGVSQKGLDAVALARHGNFFCWGFAASPEFMTEEAGAVLANAIAYIAKFDGQGLIARKYNDRRATKDWLFERKHLVTPGAYQEYLASNDRHNKRMSGIKAEAEARKARGEKLTQIEEISINYRPSPPQSFEDQLKRRYRDLFDRFGTDTAAYHRYFDENYDYFYAEPASYRLTVDEDVKSLGIPNTDPRVLARAIGLWETGEDAAKAQRILMRYTLLDYATPAEWRAWYEQNKERLFFTQTGGFVFMVDARDPAVEGNDYGRRARNQTRAALTPAGTDDLNPVSLAVGVTNPANGHRELVVKMLIHPGYHIYSHVSASDAFTATGLSFSLPSGYVLVGGLQRPAFRPYNEAGTTGIYTDEVVFTQSIAGSGEGEATLEVTWQACDAHICFPPETRTIRIAL